MFSQGELALIRLKALRRGIWHRVLNRGERSLITLTIRLVNVVKSKRLVNVLSKLVNKLREAMKSLEEKAREVGRLLAKRFAEVAQAWGHPGAKNWAKDESYVTFLGLWVLGWPS